jgi:hypothetical protein
MGILWGRSGRSEMNIWALKSGGNPEFYHLVGGDWNMNFIFPIIVEMTIQSDFHSIIFQMGRSTTNQSWSTLW